jgi:predicted Zn-dependent protease
VEHEDRLDEVAVERLPVRVAGVSRGAPALLAGVFGLTSCASQAARGLETDVAKALVTTDQENQIGLQLKTDMEQKQHVAYMTDPEVVGHVRGVADKVIAQARRDRPDVNWHVEVIDDRDTVNAFATPGGYLYVYRGLLEMAQNDAELAGVMAHETGHVVARHAARSLVLEHGAEAVTAMAAGKNPGLVAQLTSSIATKGVMLHHSREEETEADEYGARYAAAAGYDPHGLISFFQRLEKKEGSSPRFAAYLSDHPATPDRVEHVTAFIRDRHLTGTELGGPSYLAMRARLTTLPVTKTVPAPSGAPAGAPPPKHAPPTVAPPK